MKTFFVYLLTLGSFFVQAQDTVHIFLEHQTTSSKEDINPIIKGQIQRIPAHKKIGFNVFFFVDKEYAFAVAGFVYKPELHGFEKFEVTLGAGIETEDIPIKAQTSLFFETKSISNLLVLEYGHRGFWYLFVPQWKVKGDIKLGVHAERHAGLGPRLEFTTDEEGKIGAWLSPTYDFESNEFKGNIGIFAFF